MKRLWLIAALLKAALAASAPLEWIPRAEDYTQLWWADGPPQFLTSKTPPASATLCLQSGSWKLAFDTKRVRPLDQAWDCALVSGGRRFTCVGHAEHKDEFFQPVRFVESGRFFQRVVIEGLKFADSDGKEFDGDARLEISAWPDRLAFRLESASDATLELRVGSRNISGTKSVTLAMPIERPAARVESELPVKYDEALGCHTLALPEKPWSNARGTWYPEEHLDRVDRWRVTLSNDSDKPTVARLMFTQQHHLPITGFTPMLCDPDGTPTGLPVQNSKNWHRRPEKGSLPHEGPWFHGFTFVRLPPNSKRDFVFQMVYARYGGVCAASVAQLCLIGWGHNQFWDQAAIGSFGESICFEPGRVQRRCFITDVRPLMTLPQDKPGKPWSWAENCGGGDFLMWKDAEGRYQPMRATRTDYRAYGPCLTDVRYSEESTGGEISARIGVSVPRSDDHLRTFLHLRCDVHKPMQWQRLAFFQLGADFYNDTPARRVAVGNASGLRDEWEPQRAKDQFDRRAVPLTGAQPWLSIHGLDRATLKTGHAAASRGLIVRAWQAVLGGKRALPHASFFCTEQHRGNHRTVVELAPPPSLKELRPGDFVEANLELVVFPADAAAYYGPDKIFREALARDADSWRLVQREAAGNALKLQAERGAIVKPYPLVVSVDERQCAELTVEGGVGHVPVTVTGLSQPRGYRLLVDDKTVEHWQTDWNPATQRWQMTFNIASTTNRSYHLEFRRTP